MSAVFHLLAILVKVVEPELISTWRTRFSKDLRPSSSTRRKACAVRSLVCTFCSAHTPSLLAKDSAAMRILGRMRTWAVGSESKGQGW